MDKRQQDVCVSWIRSSAHYVNRNRIHIVTGMVVNRQATVILYTTVGGKTLQGARATFCLSCSGTWFYPGGRIGSRFTAAPVAEGRPCPGG